MKLRFLSKNPYKINEAQSILKEANVEVIPLAIAIPELQVADMEIIVEDKCLKAFHSVGRPLLVEHTGLFIDALNGLPGGLTQLFWDALEADKFCELFGTGPNPRVIAKTIVAYCDGKKIHQFHGEIVGTIPRSPRGPRDFQWDCVFQPDGHAETFAELGETKKNAISMRRIALDSFAHFLKSSHHA